MASGNNIHVSAELTPVYNALGKVEEIAPILKGIV